MIEDYFSGLAALAFIVFSFIITISKNKMLKSINKKNHSKCENCTCKGQNCSCGGDCNCNN